MNVGVTLASKFSSDTTKINAPVSDKILETKCVEEHIKNLPKCWKIKRVSPIHKCDKITDPDNFRPISILPIPMKFFEKVVHDQVSVFVKENSYLNDRQSGFRKLFSTTTAVLDVSEIILEEMNKNKFVGAVLIDLKEAFDTVDHKILLKKLWCYGFQNQSQSFEWFE